MDPVIIFRQLLISVLLGLLVGLQRERVASDPAGFRTFPLITVFGTLCALLAREFGYGWMLGVGAAGVITVIVIGNVPRLKRTDVDPGITTEVSMLVMFAVGAFVVVGPWIIAAAITGGVAILLHMKPQLHRFAERMGEQDFRAILQFVLITFIILPVLPNKAYDPLQALQPVFPERTLPQLDVLNPYEIWLLVVLVVAISLAGYVSFKWLGHRAGTVLGGILGGTVSSTATTVSYARRSAAVPETAGPATVVIMIAGTVVYLRVLLLALVVAPSLVRAAAGPMFALFAGTTVLAALTWAFSRKEVNDVPAPDNPTELRTALIFAVLYTIVIVALASAKAFLQDGGHYAHEVLYGISAISGMTQMDAVTLSTARLVRDGRLATETGWRMLVVATMANGIFKCIVVAVLGNRRLLKRMALLSGLTLLLGAAVLVLWP